jgi:preprotein translocase subunit SecF
MSETQSDKVSVKARIIGATLAVALLGGGGTAIGITVHNAQVEADAAHAMKVAAPAYLGAIELGGSLDQLNVQSVQAKQAYDAEQARIAAQKAAEAAAAAAAARAAAEQAAQQQAAQQTYQASQENDPAPTNDVPLVSTPGSADSGRYDTSNCGAAGATTNPDGSVTCAG